MAGEALLAAAREDLARGWSVRAGTRLRQAVESGSGEALAELARALLDGRIPGNTREARQRLETAGDALAPDACLLRAGLRYAGVGGAAEPEKALDDLAQAATDGLASAAIELALVWHERGAEGDEPARAWLARAANDSSLARELLAQLPSDASPSGDPPPVPRDWMAQRRESAAEELLNAEPRIARFRQALDPIECAWLRADAQSLLAPSLVIDPRTGVARTHPVRTGETMNFGPAVGGVFARRIAARMARLAGHDPFSGEPLVVLRYLPGQEYKPHYDWSGPDALARDPLRAAGERVTTALAYLNTPEAGGATLFPRLDVRVEPEQGAVLTFDNLDADGAPSQLALHAGEPVGAGEKWLASLWIRARPLAL